MKNLFFLLPLILVATLSAANEIIAQEPQFVFRGEDYELIKNPDGSFTQTIGLPKFIHDGTQYTQYIYSESVDYIQIETGHGSVQLDKSTCEFNYYKSGRINKAILDEEGNVIGYENNTPLLTDTIKAYQSTDTVTWNAVTQVNNAACNASWNGSELTASKTHTVGNLSYKYILNNGVWKTQLEVTNTSGLNNRYFGFAQIVDLNRDTINYGGSTKNLDNFNGQTFDRTWLVNNEGKVIDLLNGMYFDFDLAFDNLKGVQVIDTGIGKSRLIFDYSYNAQILPDGQTLIYDPTFTNFVGAQYRIIDSSAQASTACSTSALSRDQNTTFEVWKRNSGSAVNSICILTAIQISTINFPDNAVITDVDMNFVTANPSNPINCTYRPMTVDISTAAVIDVWNDILDGTPYVSNDATCTTAGSKTLDLGSSADSTFQASLTGSERFGVGVAWNDMTRDGSDHRIDFGSVTFTITYNMPPDPVRNFNATVVQSTGVELEWLAGSANGGSSPTYQILRCTGSTLATCTQIASQAGTTYTDGTPIKDTGLGYYRVRTTDSLGQNIGSFPLNGTLGDNCLSRYHFDWTVTDACLEDNDGTVTGNTLFTNSSGIVAFNFDGNSYVTLPNESDYDFERTNSFSVSMWLNKPNAIFGSIVSKLLTSAPFTGWELQEAGNKLRFFLINDFGANNYLQKDSASNINDGLWHHLVMTYDGSSTEAGVNIYFDGILNNGAISGNTISASALNNVQVTIGSRGAVNQLTANIDDVIIFNTELTAHDVENLYNSRIDVDGLPDAVTTLTATPTDLSSIELSWFVPTSRFYSITGYQINYTTPLGDPMNIQNPNTGSTSNSYEVAPLSVGVPYSFRIAPLTSYGGNYTGNIANATTFSEFTPGELILPTQGTDFQDIRYVRTDTNSTALTLDVIYPNTADLACNFAYTLAQTNNTYTGMASSAYDDNYDQVQFLFNGKNNDVINVVCWDQNDATISEKYLLWQTQFPFQEVIENFRNGTWGTAGQFSALDFVTLLVLIVSMIGFNRASPSVGVIMHVIIISVAGYFEIIEPITIMFGAVALTVMVTVGAQTKND